MAGIDLSLRRGVALVALVLSSAAGVAAGDGLPTSELAARSGGAWRTWWRSDAALQRWSAPDPIVLAAVAWRPAADGVEWGRLELAGSGEAWRVEVVLVRLDPDRLRFDLVTASRDAGTLPAWSIDDLPPWAILAVNAGQFTGGAPWGWLVRHGVVEQRPGVGPLSMAMVIDHEGRVRLIPVDEIPAEGPGDAVTAFQSYPALLVGEGEVPTALSRPGLGVDLAHRDARLAIGEDRDGHLLIALTRFAAAGSALGSLPFGPTVPEMAAIVGALGCRRAVALDGGISAQMALREPDGTLHRWRGWRNVPLALVVAPVDASRGRPAHGRR